MEFNRHNSCDIHESESEKQGQLKASKKNVLFLNVNQIDGSLVVYSFLYTTIGDNIDRKNVANSCCAEYFPFRHPNPGWNLLSDTDGCFAADLHVSHAQGLMSLLNNARFVNSVSKWWDFRQRCG